jgi:uncharacterized protein YpiB (UPF0302 family)
MKIKNLFIAAALVTFAVSCSNNPQEETKEQEVRDSVIQEQKSENELKVLEMERIDDSIRAAQEAAAKDSMSK